MEIKADKDTLYSSLPQSVQADSSKMGLKVTGNWLKTPRNEKSRFVFSSNVFKIKIPLFSVRADFLKTFLKQTVHSDKKKEKNIPLEHLTVVSEVIENPPKKRKLDQGPRKHRKTMTHKERKKMKLFDIKKEDQIYEKYIPLHNLWKDYISDLLYSGDKGKSEGILTNDAQKLLKADLHGAIITVIKSRCPSYIHTNGILLQETRNTFNIITKNNKIKCIPKLHSIFTIENAGILYTIYGNQFKVKSSERSIRKFKTKATLDL